MSTQAEVDTYFAEIEAGKQRTPIRQEEAFAKALRQDDERPDSGKPGLALASGEKHLHTQDTTMSQLPPTANATSTAQIPEDEALALMEDHGVQVQVVDDKMQALSIWTDKHAGGGIGSEWVDVVCRMDWIKAFLGY